MTRSGAVESRGKGDSSKIHGANGNGGSVSRSHGGAAMPPHRSRSEARHNAQGVRCPDSSHKPHESSVGDAPLGTSSPRLSIRGAFRGSSVLLTGVTGYVGSLVLEQLLRVCPDVGNVYVLVRAKKSLSARDRLDRLLKSGAQAFEQWP